MRSAASRSFSRACAVALAITLHTGPAAAQEYVEFNVEGELTPELRAAIAEVLSPQAGLARVFDAFPRSVPTDLVLEPGDLSIEGKPVWAGRDDTLTGDGSLVGVPALRLEDPGRIQRLPEEVRLTWGLDPGPGQMQEFLFVDRNSQLATAFGVPRDTGSAMAGNVAVPIPAGEVDRLRRLESGISPDLGMTSVVGVDRRVVTELAAIEADLRDVGGSVRVIEIPEGLSPARRDALLETFARSGVVNVQPISRPSAVEQDVLAGVDVRPVESGSCGPGLGDWPVDTEAVARTIAHDMAVMRANGLRHFRRARVLVIDSGVSETLVSHPRFSDFLLDDTERSLRRDFFWNGKDDPDPLCREGPAALGHSKYGYVPTPENSPICVARLPLGGMVPPAPHANSPNYIPEHGGLVAVLAAGGPDLMDRVVELDQLLSVGFAQVMRSAENGVVSSPADIGRSVDFARDRGFTIVNVSLRATPASTGTFVRNFNEFRDLGLTVAAAGNSGGELQTASLTFPAALGDERGDNDGLIIVGGLEKVTDEILGSRIEVWEPSSFSEQLVDILAPAKDILSLDESGQPACFTGTSVAAPQVSFVAALLHAMGYAGPAEIRRRILATARIEPGFSEVARDGRVLDMERALDIYVDLVWMDNEDAPRRVRILPPLDESPIQAVRLCQREGSTLQASDGWIDPVQLHMWARIGNGSKALIWHDRSIGITPLETSCSVPDARIRLAFADGSPEEAVDLSRIQRIVPSRLRQAMDRAWAEGLTGP